MMKRSRHVQCQTNGKEFAFTSSTAHARYRIVLDAPGITLRTASKIFDVSIVILRREVPGGRPFQYNSEYNNVRV